MDDETRIADIIERAEAATSGPWFREYGDVVNGDTDPRDASSDDPRNERIFQRAPHRGLRDERAKADSAFAAHAREDIPWLLDRLRTAEAEVVRLTRDVVWNIERSNRWEARAAEAEAVIAKAPHQEGCEMAWPPTYTRVERECDCWKSRYRAGATQ